MPGEDTTPDRMPGLAAPGTAVIARGPGDDGMPSVAIWHVNPEGAPTGAWLVSQEEALTSETTARMLLTLVERRAITGQDPEAAASVIRDLVKVAGLDPADEWWQSARLWPTVVFAQIMDRRALYLATVKARQAVSKSVQDLTWSRDFGREPTDFNDLQAMAGVAVPPGSVVVSEALAVTRVLRWLVGLWKETEQVKGRRKYVREQHGEPEALPPGWLATVRAAAVNRIAL